MASHWRRFSLFDEATCFRYPTFGQRFRSLSPRRLFAGRQRNHFTKKLIDVLHPSLQPGQRLPLPVPIDDLPTQLVVKARPSKVQLSFT